MPRHSRTWKTEQRKKHKRIAIQAIPWLAIAALQLIAFAWYIVNHLAAII